MPQRVAVSATDLDPAALAGEGIRGLILDLDNTIVPWGATAPGPIAVEWVNRLRESGLRACIVSNGFSQRVREIGRTLGLPVVAWALKPAPFALWRAMALMRTRAGETALIGDQLFTDVLGGNLLGLRTILVEPLSQEEFATTRLVRWVERRVRGRILRNRPT